ncbi:hypothetical protein ACVWZ9_003491 [Pseudomonas chlororaphis]
MRKHFFTRRNAFFPLQIGISGDYKLTGSAFLSVCSLSFLFFLDNFSAQKQNKKFNKNISIIFLQFKKPWTRFPATCRATPPTSRAATLNSWGFQILPVERPSRLIDCFYPKLLLSKKKSSRRFTMQALEKDLDTELQLDDWFEAATHEAAVEMMQADAIVPFGTAMWPL